MRTQLARSLALLTLCLSTAVAAGCSKNARGSETTVSLTDPDLGRSLKADRTIDDHTGTFRASDNVYVVMTAKGNGSGTAIAHWYYGDKREIATESHEVGPDKPRLVVFHLSNPNGLARGDYHVDITLNGVAQGSPKFTVE
jgi:hypothetical protein